VPLLVTHAVCVHLPDHTPLAFQVRSLPKWESTFSAGPAAVPTEQDPFQLCPIPSGERSWSKVHLQEAEVGSCVTEGAAN